MPGSALGAQRGHQTLPEDARAWVAKSALSLSRLFLSLPQVWQLPTHSQCMGRRKGCMSIVFPHATSTMFVPLALPGRASLTLVSGSSTSNNTAPPPSDEAAFRSSRAWQGPAFVRYVGVRSSQCGEARMYLRGQRMICCDQAGRSAKERGTNLWWPTELSLGRTL